MSGAKSNFVASAGWLNNFRERFGSILQAKKARMYGEYML
jgi:hypothetical protein